MEKKLSEEQIENIINDTETSFSIEGMSLTEENKEVGRKILSGEMDVDSYVKDYIEKNKRG